MRHTARRVAARKLRAWIGRVRPAGLGLCAGLCAAVGPTKAQTRPAPFSDNAIRIGVLTDMSGPASAASGPGAVVAAQMAAEEFGNAIAGARIEILSADHLGKPDVGSGIARKWFDMDGVDAIADLQGSPVGFAVQSVADDRHRVLLLSASTSSDFTGKACSPYTVQWTVDTYSLAVSAAKAIKAVGGQRWFFLTVDQAYGHALTRDTSEQVRRAGGEVVGNAVFPPNTGDFGPLLLQAQASKADVLALSATSGDTITAMKQAAEFGLTRALRVLPLQIVLPDTRAIGLEVAQGTYETAPFYWNRTPETRAWAEQFYRRAHAMPSGFQAGVYSSVRAYLDAVRRAGTDDPDRVLPAMRAQPVNDIFAEGGVLRPDGKMVHDMYLLRAKAPAESKGEWDLDEVVQVLPGAEVSRPLAESECPRLDPTRTGIK